MLVILMLIYTSLERERILLDTIIFVTGIVQLLCLPDYPEQIIFWHFSCDLAEENRWTLWKTVLSN